jgi:tRNA (adenine37-N6)-methyltransferase
MPVEIVSWPIAHVRGGRTEPIDDSWGQVEVEIVLDGRFADEALAGLGDFSHIDVVFHFDQVPDGDINCTARHPRDRTDWPKVGIFA